MTRSLLIVGASRAGLGVGGALGVALARPIVVWNRSLREGVDLTGAEGLDAGLTQAEGLIFAVSDDALEECIARVADRLAQGVGRPTFALHLSGARPMRALEAVRVQGVATAALHPLRTFAAARIDPEALRGVTCVLEAENELNRPLATWLQALGARVAELNPGERARYHAAAAFGANGLVALIAESARQMEQAGLSREAALAGVLRLLQGALDDVATRGPEAALTGPVVRGDVETLRRHLELPGEEGMSRAYPAVARLTLELAFRAGRLDDQAASAVRDLLNRDR